MIDIKTLVGPKGYICDQHRLLVKGYKGPISFIKDGVYYIADQSGNGNHLETNVFVGTLEDLNR